MPIRSYLRWSSTRIVGLHSRQNWRPAGKTECYILGNNQSERKTTNNVNAVSCTMHWQKERCFSTSSSTLSPSRSISVAIVGSGPSGFYTAKYLFSSLDKQNLSCSIDMLERLPTPYGLVRYGVAPDHPEVKNVENDFAALFDKNNQDTNRLNFVGNVHVGDSKEGVSVEELRQIYDVVVLAYGCESDRKLGLPEEENLSGILSAREFVAWYNGHPHPYFESIGERVAKALTPESNRDVVVIGQGNVALDCARILAKGARGLRETDISSRALPIIGEEGVPRVTIVGRRGHVQGAFTIKVSIIITVPCVLQFRRACLPWFLQSLAI